jgi:hypothetical protein
VGARSCQEDFDRFEPGTRRAANQVVEIRRVDDITALRADAMTIASIVPAPGTKPTATPASRAT